MGVDSSGLVDELPENLIKWFASLQPEKCSSEPEIVTEYKIIEVYVDSPSEDYETQNIDGTVVKGGKDGGKSGKTGKSGKSGKNGKEGKNGKDDKDGR